MDLRTILWDYDTNDWQVGEKSGVTPDAVDSMYQKMIDDAVKGQFNDVSCHSTDSYAVVESENDVVMVDGRDGPRTRAQRFYDERGDKVLSFFEKSFQCAFSSFTFVFLVTQDH